MSPEEEYTGDLRAFEAELASLCPRTDRLDRERLIFLAGRESVGGRRARPAARRWRWPWPTAFAAMTTVAASLLALLLLRPEPDVIVRFVEVPVERVAEHAAELSRRIDPSPGPRGLFSEPTGRPSPVTSIGPEWLMGRDWDHAQAKAPYPRLLDQILSQGLDSWKPPAPSQNIESADPPVPYRQLLDSLLDRQAQGRPAPDWPATGTFPYSGANS